MLLILDKHVNGPQAMKVLFHIKNINAPPSCKVFYLVFQFVGYLFVCLFVGELGWMELLHAQTYSVQPNMLLESFLVGSLLGFGSWLLHGSGQITTM